MRRGPIPPALQAKRDRDRKEAYIKAAAGSGVKPNLTLNRQLARIRGVEIDDADTEA